MSPLLSRCTDRNRVLADMSDDAREHGRHGLQDGDFACCQRDEHLPRLESRRQMQACASLKRRRQPRGEAEDMRHWHHSISAVLLRQAARLCRDASEMQHAAMCRLHAFRCTRRARRVDQQRDFTGERCLSRVLDVVERYRSPYVTAYGCETQPVSPPATGNTVPVM